MDVLFKSTCAETLPPDLLTDVQAFEAWASLPENRERRLQAQHVFECRYARVVSLA